MEKNVSNYAELTENAITDIPEIPISLLELLFNIATIPIQLFENPKSIIPEILGSARNFIYTTFFMVPANLIVSSTMLGYSSARLGLAKIASLVKPEQEIADE